MSFPTRYFAAAAALAALAAPLSSVRADDQNQPPSMQEKTSEAFSKLSPMVSDPKTANYDGALQLLNDLVPQVPADSFDRENIEETLGKIYWMGKNNPAEAAIHFKRVLDLVAQHPNYMPQQSQRDEHLLWIAEAYYQQAVALKNHAAEQRGLFDQALDYLGQYLQRAAKPTAENEELYAMLLYGKATADPAHIDKAEMVKAEDATRKGLSLERKPKAEMYQLLVAEIMQGGDYVDAAQYIELMVRNKPTSPDLWSDLYGIYSNLAAGEEKDPKLQRVYYARAINTIERAQAMGYLKKPRDNYNLVTLYYAVGQFGHAIELLHTGLRNGSIEDKAENWMNLAYFYQQIGKDIEAVNALKEAVKHFPHNSDLCFQIAEDYSQNYDTDHSYEWAKRAVDENTFHTQKKWAALQYLGYAAFELQKYPEALDAVKRAIRERGSPKKELENFEQGIEKEMARQAALKKAAGGGVQ